MTVRALVVIVLIALLVSPTGLDAQAPAVNPALAEGVRLVNEGDFEAAIKSLETAAASLRAQRGREKESATAYLYWGVAAMGLDNEQLARERFRAALGADPELKLLPKQFAAKAQRVFEEEQLRKQASAKTKTARIGILTGLLAGAGGIAAGAAVGAATAKKAIPNRPPSAEIGVQPPGTALVSVTEMRFSANATDRDGDQLTLTWAFGDGTAAQGAAVTHVYQAEGNFTVTLSANDERGYVTTATSSVSVRSLSGVWGPSPNPADGGTLVQSGASWTLTSPDGRVTARGTFTSPRNMSTFSWMGTGLVGLDSPCPRSSRAQPVLNETLSLIVVNYYATACPVGFMWTWWWERR
jgi:hypothetical protein